MAKPDRATDSSIPPVIAVQANVTLRLRIASVAILLALLVAATATGAAAQADDFWPDLQLTLLVDQGLSVPVHLTAPDDGSRRLFVAEKAGRIRIVEDGQLLATPFLDLTDRVGSWSECGLLSVAFPAEYATAGYFLVYYNYDVRRLGDLVAPDDDRLPNDDNGCDTVVARFRVTGDDPNQADPASEERILTYNQPYGNHDGGLITFGPDGQLYIGLGDGGSGGDPHNLAQNPNTLLGKLLRITVGADGTYTIPADNPFVDRKGVRPEIWALGLRNPWRYSFDAARGDLYIADVGQDAYEEVNFQAGGAAGGQNYGWRRLEGAHCYPPGSECDDAGTVLPVAEYDHTLGSSITGGFVYRGMKYPRLNGFYLYADFGAGRIWAMRRVDGEWVTRMLVDTDRQFTSFGQGADLELYLVDIGGHIYTLSDTVPASSLAYSVYLPRLQR